MLLRCPGHVPVLRFLPAQAEALSHPHGHGTTSGLHRPQGGGEGIALTAADPDAQSAGLPEDGLCQPLLVSGAAQHCEGPRGPALFHGDGSGGHVQGSIFQQPLPGKGQGLRRHVVDVAHQLGNGLPAALLRLAQEGPDAVGGGKLLGAGADAHSRHLHGGLGTEAFAEVGQQGGAGGGAQLAPDLPAVGGDAGEEVGGGGSGHRHDAVGAADLAAAHMDGRGGHTVRRQQVHGQAHAGDIRHGVQGAHLMEVDLRHRHTVGLGLGGGDAVIDGLGVGLYRLRHIQSRQNGGDVRRGGVVMVMGMAVVVVMVVFMPMVVFVFMLVMVFMAVMGLVMGCLVDVVMNGVLDGAQSHIVAVLLLAVDRHLHVGAGDAAGDGLPGRHRDAGEQAVHGVPKDVLLGLGQQLVQGGHQHVAGGAHITFQIQ